ncbi:MAG: hypothetical protein QOD77_84 [Thermoplasmata archaeon]|jgi:hypothetical protein|nr:hypothetical protein [Thermoplasmata archaeon]
MRWLAFLALALLLAGCMQSGSNGSSTPPHTFSTTTPPTSSSTTTTGPATTGPPKLAVLEIGGWVNSTGPYTDASVSCDPVAGARVDLAGKSLHLPAEADPGQQLRLVVFDRSKSSDNGTDGAPECRPSVLAGFAAGVQNYTWKIETGSGWVPGDRTFKLQPGTSTLAVDNTLLPVGKPRAVTIEFNWTRYDSAQYHYQGTLWLTYHGEWPHSTIHRDFLEHRLGLADDEAVWVPKPPIQ